MSPLLQLSEKLRRRPLQPDAAARPPLGHGLDTVLVMACALLLFSTFATEFAAEVTDLSARRILRGEVAYRDFWTMYAPGSFYTVAAAYAIFGEHIIVGNVLGVVVSAVSVAVCHRFMLRIAGRIPALCAAGVFAFALFNAGYFHGLTSYPPATLFLWLAACRLVDHAVSISRRDLLLAGFYVGAAALFKHDVAAYACVGIALALLLTSGRAAAGGILLVAAVVLAVMLPPLLMLLAAGAGPALFQDLIVFPATDFRHVRPEHFPLLPEIWSGSRIARVRNGAWWGVLHIPTLVLLVSATVLWRYRRMLTPPVRRGVLFALCTYPLYWSAAHVQANTHKVTMAALAAALGAAAWTVVERQRTPGARRRLRAAVAAALIAWGGVLSVEPVPRIERRFSERVPVGLPYFAGISAPVAEAQWLRGLHRAIAEAAPPDAPILMIGARNDVLIYAEGVPYWLTDRRFLTRHHELHPGITDTEPIQRHMLDEVTSGSLPVIVREHRFPDRILDRVGDQFRARGVAIGATLLDQWVAEHCTAGERFGMYDVLACRRTGLFVPDAPGAAAGSADVGAGTR